MFPRSANEYSSFDLDFIITGSSTRKTVRMALSEINFTEEKRYLVNPETPFFIEFPAEPLAIADEPPTEISSLLFSTGNHMRPVIFRGDWGSKLVTPELHTMTSR